MRGHPSPFDGIRKLGRRGAAGAPDPDAEIAAYLSGKVGYARDTSDLATLWQNTAGTTAVTTVADPVARVDCKFGSVARFWSQSNGGQVPAFDGTGLAFDGTDDKFTAFSDLSVSADAPCLFYSEKVMVTSLASARSLFALSINTAGTAARFRTLVTAAGAFQWFGRRLDGDAQSSAISAGGVITINTPVVLSAEFDAAGTGNVRLWVNGTLVQTATPAGSPGNISNANSAGVRIGSDLGNTGFSHWPGWMRRAVFVAAKPSAAERAMIEAWVGAL